MNPLLNQFVTESRDLIEKASRSLLELEKSGNDGGQIDALFRAVHTIKGASGLFEFTAFTQTVHAGEDLLDAVRAGDVAFSSEIADLLLDMLDRLSDWLGDLEEHEDLAEGADALGADLSGRLRARLGQTEAPDTPRMEEVQDAGIEWPDDLPVFETDSPCHLIEYSPLESAFFTGDDPMRMALATPDLVWLKMAPPAQAPDLATLDPFTMASRFRIVSTASADTLAEHFRYVEDQITIDRLKPPQKDETCAATTKMALDILHSQKTLLENTEHGASRVNCLLSSRRMLSGIAAQIGTTLPDAPVIEDLPGFERHLLDEIDRLLAELAPCGAAVAPLEPVSETTAPSASGADSPKDQAEATTDTQTPRKSSVLRVDAERVDTLMNLTGELIVAKNAMPFLARKAEEIDGAQELLREIKAQHDQINRITEELQTAIMQIRMVPVGAVLGRFNRLVRDLSRKLGKKIDLETEGEDTEADKAVVEELSDPMVHLIRNCIDHGLETPQDRRDAGKSETGRIRLVASQRDDSVVIEVIDDGRGIDVDRVTAKALERGVIDEDALGRMSREAALQLILTPGLSTKEEISDLSGRGVGMDVVASMVRRLGGSISLTSEPGEGTCVRIALPLSMAVQRLMMVEIEGGLYGVPIQQVVESQKVETSRIRRHRDGEMILLRERLIPLLRLRSMFGCPPQEEEGELISVMIVDVDGTEIGLVVDRFHPGVDAIVKPMTGILSQSGVYSGTALLGDGSVLLALDLPEIVECQYH